MTHDHFIMSTTLQGAGRRHTWPLWVNMSTHRPCLCWGGLRCNNSAVKTCTAQLDSANINSGSPLQHSFATRDKGCAMHQKGPYGRASGQQQQRCPCVLRTDWLFLQAQTASQ